MTGTERVAAFSCAEEAVSALAAAIGGHVERLLTEHVDARLRGREDDVMVERVGGDDGEAVELLGRQHLVVVDEGLLHPILLRLRRQQVLLQIAQRHHLGVLRARHVPLQMLFARPPQPDQPDPHWLRHLVLSFRKSPSRPGRPSPQHTRWLPRVKSRVRSRVRWRDGGTGGHEKEEHG